jgi:putative transferase (TIGR04331 family)
MGKVSYLACCALPDFWDKTGSMVFLHAGCVRYSQYPQLSGTSYTTLPSPYANAADFGQIHGRFSLAYEALLSALGRSLNDLHGTRYSARYWRIVLGPWLISWLLVAMERIDSLVLAASLHPNAETVGLAKENWVTSSDTRDFMVKCAEDVFNLQLYTEILLEEKLAITLRELKSAQTAAQPQAQPRMGLTRTLIAKALWASYVLDFPKHDAIVVDGFLLKRTALPLWWKSGFKLWPQYTQRTSFTGDAQVSPELRQKLLGLLQLHATDLTGPEFQTTCLVKMAARYLPTAFVEGYFDLCHHSEKLYPRRPNAILTSNAFFYDESFKHWAGKSADEGSKLLFAQHGGNHELSAFEPVTEHESTVPDAYLAWGAADRTQQGKSHYGPPLNLAIAKGSQEARPQSSGILFGVTHVGRYMHTLIPLMSPQRFEEYLLRQKGFSEALDGNLKKHLKVRVLHDYLGWDVRKRWQDQCPEASIDNGESPFQAALMSSRIYVCDHLMTTYLEALRANVPTILFWNEADYALPADSIAWFARLKKAGILHTCERSAADAVGRVYENAYEWWATPEIQDAKSSFIERYAPAHADPMDFWSKKITALVRNNCDALR